MNHPRIQKFGNKFATESIAPGTKVYGEIVMKKGGQEFRVWDIYRSKLAAAIKNGLKNLPIDESTKVLYLGAGNGTTASHISDLTPKGILYCLEFSPRAMVDLFSVCKIRKNMVPILGDANKPYEYMNRVSEVDILYQDVAQKNQVDILIKNAEYFLKPNGRAFLMVKARSIDVTKEPNRVFDIVANELMRKFRVIERIKLDPYEKDHECILVELK